MNKNLVIMFVKEPKLGFVKTRLSKSCGEEFTLGLYKSFVKDLINTLSNESYDFKLCGFPNLELINNTFGNFDNFLQVKGDLGIKMKEAFVSQFKQGYEKIVLIGSDTPHITKELINESFNQLEKNDMTLGPSLDGGYYLISFNKSTLNEYVFDDISWSTSKVREQTLKKLENKNIYLHEVLNDIDILDDLKTFHNEYKDSTFQNSLSIKFLNQNKNWQTLK